MVAGDVGLALAGVDDDRVHLAKAGGDLHMGGEGGPAHAHDARLLHQGGDLLGGKGVGVLGRDAVGTGGVVEVVLNNDAHDGHAGEVDALLHRRHRAGDAGVDGGGDEGGGVPHLLPHGHLVANRHAGGAGRADVQGHGDHHPGGRREGFDGLFVGGGLVVVGMDAAEKGLCHRFTSFSFQFGAVLSECYHTPIRGRCPDGFCHFFGFFCGICRKIRSLLVNSVTKSGSGRGCVYGEIMV